MNLQKIYDDQKSIATLLTESHKNISCIEFKAVNDIDLEDLKKFAEYNNLKMHWMHSNDSFLVTTYGKWSMAFWSKKYKMNYTNMNLEIDEKEH